MVQVTCIFDSNISDESNNVFHFANKKRVILIFGEIKIFTYPMPVPINV